MTTAPHPWTRLLLIAATIFLLRGVWVTWPAGAVQEWPQPGFFGGARSLQFDPHGTLVLREDETTLTWYDPTQDRLDSDQGGNTEHLTTARGMTDFAISAEGQFVATGTKNGALTLWTGAPAWHAVETLQVTPPGGGNASVSSLSFSADGRRVGWVANTTRTLSIRVWDRVTHQDRFTLTQLAQGETGVYDYWDAHLSPDGQQIMLIGRAIELRRVEDQALIYQIARAPGSSETFARVAFSPDQRWFAHSGSGQVTIRRFSDGGVVQVLQESPNSDYLIAFSPDSRYLAVAENTTSSGGLLVGAPTFPSWKPVTLYQVSDWRVVQTFQGHVEGAFGLAYSPDGQYLATYGASGDRTIRLWRVSPHNPFEPLFWLGGGLALLIVAVGRWIWQRRRARA